MSTVLALYITLITQKIDVIDPLRTVAGNLAVEC